MLTLEYLKSHISYNPVTGEIKGVVGNSGKKASVYEVTRKINKYIQITIDRKKIYGHRIAVFFHYGIWPDQVDHIDGNGLNNAISNLKIVSDEINKRNLPKRLDNKSGVTGVYFSKKGKIWVAQISFNKKHHRIGSFKDMDSAIIARLLAEERHGYSGRSNIKIRELYSDKINKQIRELENERNN